MSGVDRDLTHEVEQFLYHEAWLLEEGRFTEWLALMTDDVIYHVPNRRADGAMLEDAVIARDDLAALRMRIDRMHDPLNPALQPPPRTKYFVTNVAVAEREADELRVRSSVLLYIVRDRTVRHHPMSCTYRLRPVDGSLRIASKRVYVLENSEALRVLPVM